MRKISLSNLDKLFAKIAENAKLYIPVDGKNGTASFKLWEDGVVMSQALNTTRSAKDFFFPQTENLMEFKTEGKNIEIIDIPGYSPINNDEGMLELAKDAFYEMFPEDKDSFKVHDGFGSGSTDMGDLSCIMPVVHPYSGGATGKGHGSDYQIADPEKACVMCAKWQVAMARMLLEGGAERAKKIISEFKPLFASKEEFLAYVDALSSSGDRIEYTDDGRALVKLN